MNLDEYLIRIGYHGATRVNLDTLTAIHRAHLQTIPYENLDIHLGRTLSLNEDAIFAKLVTGRRGGWCYEMNGLLAWALEQTGFQVTRLASTVGRQSPDTEDGAHLILLVELDRTYLADVGFGNGLLEPIPLEVGTYQQGFLKYRLDRAGERWHFSNVGQPVPTIDFTLRPRRQSDFASYCTRLQTDPECWFVQTTVCHRRTADGIASLRGAVLRTITAGGAAERVVGTYNDYVETLDSLFGLSLPPEEAAVLWAKVWDRHTAWMAAQNQVSRV
jgi:N-hydroxyarylamine O-acetyltransferase